MSGRGGGKVDRLSRRRTEIGMAQLISIHHVLLSETAETPDIGCMKEVHYVEGWDGLKRRGW